MTCHIKNKQSIMKKVFTNKTNSVTNANKSANIFKKDRGPLKTLGFH